MIGASVEQWLLLAGICFATTVVFKLITYVCTDNVRWIVLSILVGIIISVKGEFTTKKPSPVNQSNLQEQLAPALQNEEKDSQRTIPCTSINSKDMECSPESQSLHSAN